MYNPFFPENVRPKENLMTGFSGAFLFSFLGVAIWVLVGQNGIIAGLCGFLMVCIPMISYRIFAKDHNGKVVIGPVILLVMYFVLRMVVLGVRISMLGHLSRNLPRYFDFLTLIIAALCGFFMLYITMIGYRIFAKNLSGKGIAIATCVSLVMIFVSVITKVGVHVYTTWSSEYQISILDACRLIPSSIAEPNVHVEVIKNLVCGYVGIIIIFVISIARGNKSV